MESAMGRLNWSKAAQDRRLREQGSEPLAAEDQTLRRGWLPSEGTAFGDSPSFSAPAVLFPKPSEAGPQAGPQVDVCLPTAPTTVAIQKAKGSSARKRIDIGFMVSRVDGTVTEIQFIQPSRKSSNFKKPKKHKKIKSRKRY
jgi:hypothetical protein